jgi:NTE family protein
MAFHSGVLRWLAEKGAMENVQHVSSVSGGTLLVGLVFCLSGYEWPTSRQYIERILPDIRALMTTTSLQFDAITRLVVNPFCWRFALSRANILAISIERLWGVSATLGDLPKWPVWSINGTTAEDGKRFRMKTGRIGDYEIGYAQAQSFKLAEAMAVSAAFPLGVGPLRIDTSLYRWSKRPTWQSAGETEVQPQHKFLHIYDGGVYDNLAMEPLFDVGKQIVKTENTVSIDFLMVADASAPFSRRAIPGPFRLGRLKRVADIGFDQARALRVRSFVNFLQSKPGSGMYLQMGSNPSSCIDRYARPESSETIRKAEHWLPSTMVSEAASYKTTLAKVSSHHFDLIAEHGYQTALWNSLVFPGNNQQVKRI